MGCPGAMESVLGQEGVALELIVVDDGSTDNTAEIVASYQDARVRLLQNKQQMGIGYCHNIGLRESRSPLIAHVDADDFLLAGALRKMIEALQGDAQIGQAHCYFFDVDEQGRTTGEEFGKRWVQFRRNRPPTLDYKAKLAQGANVTNALRTYRRAVLEELGGFNERLRFGIDYDMALRLLEHYTIKLVPEFLYCRRLHRSNTTESLRFKTLRFWVQMYRIRRQLAQTQKVGFLASAHLDLYRFIRGQVLNTCDRVSQQ
ncbi:MAG: glycosyltransferase [Deltaproteobacteria bacterium]|nr:glycosyltransferase [Deltaproteobacteria bacterium]